MSNAFEVVAEPNRRRILDLLRAGRQSVGGIGDRLRLNQPAVSKHLRVLKEARLVAVERDAQRRLYRLCPEPLLELEAWLAPYRALWSARLDALEGHLDSMPDEPAPRAKRASAARARNDEKKQKRK